MEKIETESRQALRQSVLKLDAARKGVSLAKAAYEFVYDKFKTRHAKAIKALEDAKQTLKQADDQLRQEALDAYLAGDLADKHPAPGIVIKTQKGVVFGDVQAAQKWMAKNAPTLITLEYDMNALEKAILQGVFQGVPGAEVVETHKAYIDTDLTSATVEIVKGG